MRCDQHTEADKKNNICSRYAEIVSQRRRAPSSLIRKREQAVIDKKYETWHFYRNKTVSRRTVESTHSVARKGNELLLTGNLRNSRVDSDIVVLVYVESAHSQIRNSACTGFSLLFFSCEEFPPLSPLLAENVQHRARRPMHGVRVGHT